MSSGLRKFAPFLFFAVRRGVTRRGPGRQLPPGCPGARVRRIGCAGVGFSMVQAGGGVNLVAACAGRVLFTRVVCAAPGPWIQRPHPVRHVRQGVVFCDVMYLAGACSLRVTGLWIPGSTRGKKSRRPQGRRVRRLNCPQSNAHAAGAPVTHTGALKKSQIITFILDFSIYNYVYSCYNVYVSKKPRERGNVPEASPPPRSAANDY